MPNTLDALLDDARAGLADVVSLRRDLHAHPELGLDLPRTQRAVLDALDGLPLDVRCGTAVSSVVADLRGAADGPVVVLRADMDALPMPEDTGLEFASTVDGTMHACGHDAHTAMLAGAARLLAERRDDLAGTVRLMFQPGEEGFHGARSMIEEGLLEPRVDAAFALHVSPNLPTGTIAGRAGCMMASADVVDIVVTGTGGHASTPYLANDPMPVAAEIVQALQVFATRRINTFDPIVITIAKMRAGTTNNVIPERVLMQGTIRAVSAASRELAHAGIERIATNIAIAHEMHAEVTITRGYAPTINHESGVEHARATATDLLGDRGWIEMPSPMMGAEDFSYVLEERPGAILFLGACPPGARPRTAPACHSNRMQIDEDALAVGVAYYAALASKFLTADANHSA
ncbi:MAG TPA: M20 family metallopeptidase [Acidimicrobiia bacterium]|nr:M20 family metallopeptidase [Acidimicrobiia bacterium]